MRPRHALGTALLLLAAGTLAPAPGSGRDVPLPALMADTGGGSQLITAQAEHPGSTTGKVTWWDRRPDGRWEAAGSADARFGANGLVEGDSRKQGTSTTPTGLYDLPYAFGVLSAPVSTDYAYRRVDERSWWCQDNGSRAYNRWVDGLPEDCRAGESEHLISYRTQYAHALVIGFNYERPVRGRGAGIFLHVNGRGATSGCVSVPAAAMRSLLAWADRRRDPHIAIGTASGRTAVSRY
ncbi:L,D-transpeptidase [Streptomyces sp. NPDC002889]|uniref:L,D-transpeptidase family protein n=1 Tax=Streptomyces sp. NPDC002889 TaxID=3364669 RepID=UPI0036BD2EF8